MEPDRFDDVESTILEAPEPRERNPLRRRVALVMTIGLLASGGLAAGADALTSGGSGEAARTPAKVTRNADGIPVMREGHPCQAGQGARRHHGSSSAPRY
jgi:hypothetical protein